MNAYLGRIVRHSWKSLNRVYCTPAGKISQLLSEYLLKNDERLSSQFSDLSQKVHSEDTTDLRANLDRWSKLKSILKIKEMLEALRAIDCDSLKLLEELDDGTDLSLPQMVEQERKTRQIQRAALENQLVDILLPQDKYADHPSVKMELIAGAGGLEAAMFARDLFNMYHSFAKSQGWRFLVEDTRNADGAETTGGSDQQPIDYVAISIDSLSVHDHVFAQLRWEAGVHRVQRVPITSKQNKIHTSTVAVTVLPAVNEADIELDPNDLEWEVFRSSGAGGQHVNKTESAVRVRHRPTGRVAACQTARSQHANRESALELLKSKISKDLLEAHMHGEQSQRKSQMGSLARSDRIRTYNYPQDRITDHRLGQSWSNLAGFMREGGTLREIASTLNDLYRLELLRNLEIPDFLH